MITLNYTLNNINIITSMQTPVNEFFLPASHKPILKTKITNKSTDLKCIRIFNKPVVIANVHSSEKDTDPNLSTNTPGTMSVLKIYDSSLNRENNPSIEELKAKDNKTHEMLESVANTNKTIGFSSETNSFVKRSVGINTIGFDEAVGNRFDLLSSDGSHRVVTPEDIYESLKFLWKYYKSIKYNTSAWEEGKLMLVLKSRILNRVELTQRIDNLRQEIEKENDPNEIDLLNENLNIVVQVVQLNEINIGNIQEDIDNLHIKRKEKHKKVYKAKKDMMPKLKTELEKDNFEDEMKCFIGDFNPFIIRKLLTNMHDHIKDIMPYYNCAPAPKAIKIDHEKMQIGTNTKGKFCSKHDIVQCKNFHSLRIIKTLEKKEEEQKPEEIKYTARFHKISGITIRAQEEEIVIQNVQGQNNQQDQINQDANKYKVVRADISTIFKVDKKEFIVQLSYKSNYYQEQTKSVNEYVKDIAKCIGHKKHDIKKFVNKVFNNPYQDICDGQFKISSIYVIDKYPKTQEHENIAIIKQTVKKIIKNFQFTEDAVTNAKDIDENVTAFEYLESRGFNIKCSIDDDNINQDLIDQYEIKEEEIIEIQTLGDVEN